MKVMVVGKEIVSGVSKKTEQPYKATIVHCTYKKGRVEGLVAENLWVDQSLIDPKDIFVGTEYEVDRDSRGFLMNFSEIF